jgi:xanthine dehydrogenase accessory factor
VRLDVLAALNGERTARRACVVVTDLASGAQQLVLAADCVREPWRSDPLADALAEALRTGASRMVEVGTAQHLLVVHVPPVRIIATGAVHITQAMQPMAAALGLDLTVIDPRGAFATAERFPGVTLLEAWPDEALPGLGLDRYTAVVALTHDPKIDDPALHAALRSECFYVGALGSRKTHARRIERLIAAGFSQADAARIKAPIGLNIGAASPAEIALSILAEIIASLRAERVAAKTPIGV